MLKKIRECKTKEELFSLFENESCSEMKHWEEDDYKYARSLLSEAMGNPETHYGVEHGFLTEENMFAMDVEMFLSRNWEYAVKLEELQKRYKVYRIFSKMHYDGFSLVAADSAEEANKFIEEFRKSDPDNGCDSFGYTDVEETDLEENLFSTEKGIVLQGINYIG